MVWYWIFVLLSTVLFSICVYLAYRFRSDKLDDFIDWVKPNIRRIIIAWVVVIGILTFCLIRPIINTVACQFDGITYKVDTSYSWYKNGSYADKCLFTGKNGALLPLRIIRDQPDGDHTSDAVN